MGDGGERTGAGAGLTTGGDEVIDIALDGGDGEHVGTKGVAIGLRCEPGDEIAQAAEVGGNRLGVAAAERCNNALEDVSSHLRHSGRARRALLKKRKLEPTKSHVRCLLGT